MRPASRLELRRFHDRRYLDLVEKFSAQSGRMFLDSGDTPSFPGCGAAASRIVGGAIASLESVRVGRARRAFHPAGGLHHAHRSRAAGFCIFNDVGVALALATGPGGAYRRVAYVDIDAHHGDGVMYGFFDSGRVLDIDFHQDGRTLFPGTGAVEETGQGDGAGLKANVPLPPGTGDRGFASAFLRVVPTLLRSYRPEIIVLQHGVDGHFGDPLARLRYSASSFSLAVGTLMALAEELCQGRLIVTGGGGYNPRNVARLLAACGFLLSGQYPPEGALPGAWRARFEVETGGRAPANWPNLRPAPAGDPSPRAIRNVVRALSEELGVKFPSARTVR
ncbi:MAG: acetoin utilization protein AcuC [Thermoplasmata archaeon]|nr:acetoin utilization protein AcuC [Thermoplasmata archaeon]MCI4359395.1 acetoin utilization protein AcuC [Thermoplasmata archaeon]